MKFAGPLQAWGAESRYSERKTRHEPTKSGVVGLLAAALGRRRSDPVDDLAAMPLFVRTDQPGHYEKDFQTARQRKFNKVTQRWEPAQSLPLSNRYYLSDAIFIIGLEVPAEQLDYLATALQRPAFPLFLGRRSCSPSEKIFLDALDDISPIAALKQLPWHATSRALINKHLSDKSISCSLTHDQIGDHDEYAALESICDYPISFSQEHREYGWRTAIRTRVHVPNPHFRPEESVRNHDPMSLFEELR